MIMSCFDVTIVRHNYKEVKNDLFVMGKCLYQRLMRRWRVLLQTYMQLGVPPKVRVTHLLPQLNPFFSSNIKSPQFFIVHQLLLNAQHPSTYENVKVMQSSALQSESAIIKILPADIARCSYGPISLPCRWKKSCTQSLMSLHALHTETHFPL